MSDPNVGKSTFTWWVTYEVDSEVKRLKPEDLIGYESNYVKCWNYLRDTGWEKIKGSWVSKEGMKFKTVYEAYNSQKFKELVDNKCTTT